MIGGPGADRLEGNDLGLTASYAASAVGVFVDLTAGPASSVTRRVTI